MESYLDINKALWNARTKVHTSSSFYDLNGFLKGNSSLIGPEVDLLTDIRGKDLLHLQCHFGLDTLSLARLGAQVTGLDFSEEAISFAQEVAKKAAINARFVCSDVYSAPEVLNRTFDVIYTSYGVIGWLPDMNKWANTIAQLLKPGGKLVLAEFHPVIWMLDDQMESIAYPYFNKGQIVSEISSTYTTDQDGNRSALDQSYKEISWNHSLGEVIASLLKEGMTIEHFEEFDYSPYPCFVNMQEDKPHCFRFLEKHGYLPIMYTISAKRGVT